jgi:hypothetical protein
MINEYTFASLPSELLHEIAQQGEAAYRALLSVPLFARTLTLSIRVDYQIRFGYSVTVRPRLIKWTKNGQLHRADGPAYEWPDGTKEWWQNGQLHRADGPAYERPDGTKEWWQNGRRHRADGPAREWPDGIREWWQNGQRLAADQRIPQFGQPDGCTALAASSFGNEVEREASTIRFERNC